MSYESKYIFLPIPHPKKGVYAFGWEIEKNVQYDMIHLYSDITNGN
jgi:hypothetical protein